MTDGIEKLKARIQKDLPDGWTVDHVNPFTPESPVEGLGDYRAYRVVPNGTLVTQHGDTPEGLVAAVEAYDTLQAAAVAAGPTVTAGTLATPAKAADKTTKGKAS